MIILSTVEFNPIGQLSLNEDPSRSDIRSITRRVTRTPTLDGGAAVDDAGFSDGDRTISLVLPNLTETEFDNLQTIVAQYPDLLITTDDGTFSGGVESLRFSGGVAYLRFLVESKVSA